LRGGLEVRGMIIKEREEEPGRRKKLMKRLSRIRSKKLYPDYRESKVVVHDLN